MSQGYSGGVSEKKSQKVPECKGYGKPGLLGMTSRGIQCQCSMPSFHFLSGLS